MLTCIYVRNKNRKEFINACINIFMRKLKLQNSRWNLIVLSTKNLKGEQNSSGMVYQGEENTLVMELDSSLDGDGLIDTISHEMIHVKQIATGLLQEKKGKTYWRGKLVDRKKVKYWDQPWEKNAWMNQAILANSIYRLMPIKRKKSK